MPLTRAAAEGLSKNWWAILLLGIVSVIVGIVVLSVPWTLRGVIYFFGAFLIFRGIFLALSSPVYRGFRTWNVVLGILSILVGIAVFVWPFYTLLMIATFIGVWLMVSGVFDIVGSIANRRLIPYWWMMLLRGIFAVPLGIWALYRPGLTLVTLIMLFGIWAFIIGIWEIVASFEIKNLPAHLDRMATAGGPFPTAAS